MVTLTYIEAFGWCSTFVLIWLLLLGEIEPSVGSGMALAFFFITGLVATLAQFAEAQGGHTHDQAHKKR